MKYCGQCGYELEMGSRFCGHCGTRLPDDAGSAGPVTRTEPVAARTQTRPRTAPPGPVTPPPSAPPASAPPASAPSDPAPHLPPPTEPPPGAEERPEERTRRRIAAVPPAAEPAAEPAPEPAPEGEEGIAAFDDAVDNQLDRPQPEADGGLSTEDNWPLALGVMIAFMVALVVLGVLLMML